MGDPPPPTGAVADRTGVLASPPSPVPVFSGVDGAGVPLWRAGLSPHSASCFMSSSSIMSSLSGGGVGTPVAGESTAQGATDRDVWFRGDKKAEKNQERVINVETFA